MEKVVCAAWRTEAIDGTTWASQLLEDAGDLRDRGATAITVHLTDEAVAAGEPLHLGPLAPAALVSWWCEESTEVGPIEWVATRSARHAAFLVTESRPLVPPPPANPGARSEGFVTVACIAPRTGLTIDAFRDRWFGPHRAVAIETQASTGYVRNEVVRPLTDGAPAWAGIVEETFPIGALDDPAVFFDAVGNPERQADHERRMFESVAAFLDLATVERHPMSEYRLA